MKIEKLLLTIESPSESRIGCCARDEWGEVRFDYYPITGKLDFNVINHPAEVLLGHQFQFEKIIRSAVSGKLTPGQEIRCVFIGGFRFLKETDYDGFIRLDRREGKLDISSTAAEREGIHKIYTDGSFARESMTSGYGGIIQYPGGERDVFSGSPTGGGSNQMELLAVLEGLKRLEGVTEIQVNTDSRFVIRGMAQWMHFWRHNDWQTAYGRDVKFAGCWRHLYQLSAGKLLEFRWIKGHSGHAEQEFCHRLARKSAER